jgi:hypothetical protein
MKPEFADNPDSTDTDTDTVANDAELASGIFPLVSDCEREFEPQSTDSTIAEDPQHVSSIIDFLDRAMDEAEREGN